MKSYLYGLSNNPQRIRWRMTEVSYKIISRCDCLNKCAFSFRRNALWLVVFHDSSVTRPDIYDLFGVLQLKVKKHTI